LKTNTILKNTISLSFVILLALALSACGSSTKTATDDGTITYDGITSPAAITADNAVELTSKAAAIGMMSDADTAYSSALEAASASKASIAEALTNDAMQNAYDKFITRILNTRDIIPFSDDLEGYGGQAIDTADLSQNLIGGTYTKEVSFDDATDTFTVVNTFVNAKIINNPGSTTDRKIADVNGIITETFTCDYSEYTEPTKATPVAVWAGMTPAEKLEWAFDNEDEYPITNYKKNCGNVTITFTVKSSPVDLDDFDPNLFAAGYGGYGGYDYETVDTYEITGLFDLVETDISTSTDDGYGGSTETFASDFTGSLAITSTDKNMPDNKDSSFTVVSDGEAHFKYNESKNTVYTPGPEKADYAFKDYTYGYGGSVMMAGAIDLNMTVTDSIKSETITANITDGAMETVSDYNIARNYDVNTSDLDDEATYTDESSTSKLTQSLTISGSATASLEIGTTVLASVPQTTSFTLESGSASYTKETSEKLVEVRTMVPNDLVVEESSYDMTEVTSSAFSGSAKISHMDADNKELFIALSGELLTESSETVHDDNPGEDRESKRDSPPPESDPTLGDHVSDVSTIVRLITVNKLKLATDFMDIALQGTIAQDIDRIADYYDDNVSTLNIDMIIEDNITTNEYWFKNYVVTINTGGADKGPSAPGLALTVSGEFLHSAFGAVDVTTASPFTFNNDDYDKDIRSSYSVLPYSGTLEIAGATGTSAALSAVTLDGEPSGYMITADTDGDGTDDLRTSKAWPDFEGFIENYWLFNLVQYYYNADDVRR